MIKARMLPSKAKQGRMHAEISQTLDGVWYLQIFMERRFDLQVLRTFTVGPLIEVIELASLLQLHVDNIAELPLSQYLPQAA